MRQVKGLKVIQNQQQMDDGRPLQDRWRDTRDPRQVEEADSAGFGDVRAGGGETRVRDTLGS